MTYSISNQVVVAALMVWGVIAIGTISQGFTPGLSIAISPGECLLIVFSLSGTADSLATIVTLTPVRVLQSVNFNCISISRHSLAQRTVIC